MPAVTVHTFNQRHGGAIGRPTLAFRWQDDPAEDEAFAEVMQSTGNWINVIILRPEGGTTRVQWEDGSMALPQQRKISVGTYWHPSPYNSETLDYALGPGPLDPGYWECDDYGRPFDLNDLVAEPQA